MKLFISILLLASLLILPFDLLAEKKQTRQSYSEFKKLQKEKYQTFKDGYLKRYIAYKEELRKKWGIVELSSSTEYITYDDSKNVKVVADFENDFVEISTQGKQAPDKEALNVFLYEALMSNLNFSPEDVQHNNEEFSLASYESKYSNPRHSNLTTNIGANSLLSYLGVEDISMLKNIVTHAQKIPESTALDNVEQRTSQRLQRQIAQVEQFNTNNDFLPEKNEEMLRILHTDVNSLSERRDSLTQKNITSYRFSVKRDRFKKAHKYLGMVTKYSKKWAQQKEFLLAIIETESHFNPTAISLVPAYGLMQIVPSTAGADVNKKIFSIDQHPTVTQLYDSDQNIKYGSAYLYILMNEYLTDIEDPKSRLYCAIAAYNTGIGNLAKAFNNGRRGLKTAISNINDMPSDEVLKVISSKTHTETQRYIVKVLNSQRYFAEHLGSMLVKL